MPDVSQAFFKTLVEGKINRPLLKPLNHMIVKTADQRLKGLSGVIGGLLRPVKRSLSRHTSD